MLQLLNLREYSAKSLITNAVLIILAICLMVLHLFGSFKGMSDREAMEAAAVGREITRGNGFNNKVIYPVALYDSSKNDSVIEITNHQNTFIAPGHALVNASILSLVNGGDAEAYQLKQGQFVYQLDRYLAIGSAVFLFVATIFTYLLASEMFEKKIGIATAFIMLTSASMWSSVESCMPQMFLMMLFCINMWILFKAFKTYENTTKIPWLHLSFCAALFALMVITKWLTIWIFIGYLITILFRFKARGAIATLTLAIAATLILPAILFNLKHYGSPFGQSIFTIVNSLAKSESIMLRTYGEQQIRIDNLLINFVQLSYNQIANMIPLLAGIIVAPLFFLALLHRYNRDHLNSFKFVILSMWILSVIGMAIFGGKELHANSQIHIIFAPVMAIIGLSFLHLTWSKLSISESRTIFENAHIIIVCAICSAPLLSKVPTMVVTLFEQGGKGLPNAPYFKTAELTKDLPEMVNKLSSKSLPVIYSDQPAATAWYSDVHSIALPMEFSQFYAIENIAGRQGIEIVGIHTSASSTKHIYDNREYLGILPLVNLPLTSSFSGVPVAPSIDNLSKYWPDAKKPSWYQLGKSYPHYIMIKSPDRHQKEFGQHIFHSRKSTQ